MRVITDLELVNALLTVSFEDVLEALPGALSIRQSLPLHPTHFLHLSTSPSAMLAVLVGRGSREVGLAVTAIFAG